VGPSSIWKRLFEEGGGGRDLKPGTQLSMKAPKNVGVNSSGEVIYTQFIMRFMRGNNKVMQRHMILRGDPVWKKL